jgi:hypothetical protein
MAAARPATINATRKIMEMRLKGQKAIDDAEAAMAARQVFTVLDRNFKVVEVTTTKTTETGFIRGVARLEAELTRDQIAGYAKIAGMRSAEDTVVIDLNDHNI